MSLRVYLAVSQSCRVYEEGETYYLEQIGTVKINSHKTGSHSIWTLTNHYTSKVFFLIKQTKHLAFTTADLEKWVHSS